MGEWKEYLLDEVIEKFIDYRGKTPTKTDSGVPLITAKVVKNGTIEEPNEFISKDDYHGWMRRGYPEVDDIVLTTEAPLGEVALLKTKDVALAQRIITLRANPKKAYNPFIKYYLQSPPGQFELESRASGTTVLGIKSSVLKKLPVMLPDLPEQRAIASVLSSLDAKIDLLHRQNKTLEAMAEALFRQWFVEYKAPGTKMAAGEALPDGWKVVALGDIADLNWGDTNATKKLYVEKGYTAYSAAGPDGFLPYYDYDRTGIVVSAIGSAGNTYLAMGKWSCIKNTIRFWATNPSVSTEYLYQATLGAENWPLRGTVQPFISQGDARAMEVVLPADGLAAQYGDMVRPMYIKIEANKEQITSLTKLRDTLLPKLMSGEVRVEVEHAQMQ